MVACEEHQRLQRAAENTVSPLAVSSLASGHKKSEGNEDRLGLPQWGNRKVMEDIWPNSVCPPEGSISFHFHHLLKTGALVLRYF